MSVFLQAAPLSVADANMRVLAVKAGLTVREIPVPMEERTSGESMHSGAQAMVGYGKSLAAVIRTARP
jgi:hypothetical protein